MYESPVMFGFAATPNGAPLPPPRTGTDGNVFVTRTEKSSTLPPSGLRLPMRLNGLRGALGEALRRTSSSCAKRFMYESPSTAE
eukprot:CAMPEP_0115870492 /NCGR_PEP_ID=MMETSP0287-20121206/22356_1 /TAXON_ID=412157 /ORGANISM="Chrysochromulina rotalis, Strain UIO044" /LENGTH=83 /DNA_ID=CAMNT_0003325219 /DNA_START=501 /DNA_END=752 /DNA_ORIENTATION=+